MPLENGRTYLIQLCSGERRLWRYQGTDATGQAWWRDEDSGEAFGESRLMYAWQLLGALEPPGPAEALPAAVYRRLAEQMDAALVLADPQGIIRLWNGAAEGLFGFPAAAALGAGLDLIIPPHLRAAHWRGFHAAFARGAVQQPVRPRLTRALHADGSKRYVTMSFSVIRDDDGQAEAALALAWAAEGKAEA